MWRSWAAWGPVFCEKSPDRPVGTPTVETIEVNSPGLSVARTMSSILATVRSVSSTRVPTGARTRMMNWLSSEAGKNSVPINGSRATALAAMTRIAPTSRLRWPGTEPSMRT